MYVTHVHAWHGMGCPGNELPIVVNHHVGPQLDREVPLVSDLYLVSYIASVLHIGSKKKLFS